MADQRLKAYYRNNTLVGYFYSDYQEQSIKQIDRNADIREVEDTSTVDASLIVDEPSQ